MRKNQKSSLRVIAENSAKIVTLLGMLLAVVKGYYQLEQQGQLLLEALGSKLNSLAIKVEVLEGRVAEFTDLKVLPSPVTFPREPAAPKPSAPDAEYVVMTTEGPATAEVFKEGVGFPELNLKAYDPIPLKMNQLQKLQQQAAAPPVLPVPSN